MQFSQQYYTLRRKNNRADIDSIYKQIIKIMDLEDVS